MRAELQRLKRDTDSSRNTVVVAAEPGIALSSVGTPVAASSTIPGASQFAAQRELTGLQETENSP